LTVCPKENVFSIWVASLLREFKANE